MPPARLNREPRRIEVRERLFQLGELLCRAVHFQPGEIDNLEQFREQTASPARTANVGEMGEHAFGRRGGFCFRGVRRFSQWPRTARLAKKRPASPAIKKSALVLGSGTAVPVTRQFRGAPSF